MGAIALPPKKRVVKPEPWDVTPKRVDPKWRWAWEGLQFALLFWEGRGTPLDAALHEFAVTDLSGAAWDVGPRGYIYDLSGATGGTEGEVHRLALDYQGVTGSQNRTQFLRVKPPSSNSKIGLSDWGDSANNAQQAWRFVLDNNDGNLRTEVSSGFYKTAGDFSDGSWHDLAQVLRGTQTDDIEHWADGRELSQSDLNSNDVNTLGDVDVGFGDTVTSNNTEFNGDVSIWAVWDRALSPEYLSRLTRDPFGPFRPREQIIVRVPSAGDQTISAPVAAATAEASAPQVAPATSVSAPGASASAESTAPTVSPGTATVPTPVAEAIAEAAAPQVAASVGVSSPVADVEVTALPPSVQAAISLAAAGADVEATAAAPQASPGTATPSVPVATVTVTVLDVTVLTGELFVNTVTGEVFIARSLSGDAKIAQTLSGDVEV